ncbi:cytochrome P450 [Blastococcus sp. URHD0036]|uniref:cytochrome P450 n=1 Tax=Blastococcus sp. URHD0036 TaxID=1380356 RepID=UPI0012DDA5FE|nr:cytochrome P450 [Blastococcus sp. URHD0036]
MTARETGVTMEATGLPLPEFDHYSDFYTQNTEQVFADLRNNAPVAYSRAYDGGFYIVSRYQQVRDLLADHEGFGSAKWVDDDGVRRGGVSIPTSAQPPLLPLELDPPQATEYRRLLSPWFSLKRTEQMRPRITELTNALIDEHVEKGQLDVVLDIGNPVPAIVTLELIGLPLDDWQGFAEPMHQIVAALPGSELFLRAAEGVARVSAALAELVAQRRVEPANDLASHLCQAEVNGAPIPDEDIVNILMTVVGGGVDTTTSVIAGAIGWLDEHPEDRRRLIEEPELLPLACEEFIRYLTPAQIVSRTVRRDACVSGQALAPGDRLALALASANRDETVFDRANEVVVDREPVRHIGFGFGVHRCIGAPLGRVELQVMLGELLRRVPDFQVQHDEIQRYPKRAKVNGFVQMPITFRPRQPEAAGSI